MTQENTSSTKVQLYTYWKNYTKQRAAFQFMGVSEPEIWCVSTTLGSRHDVTVPQNNPAGEKYEG